MKFHTTCILVLFHILAGVALCDAQNAIQRETFEDGISCWAWGNGAAKLTDSGISQEKARSGKGSLKLSWDFGDAPKAGEFCALGLSLSFWGQPVKYAMWIHGDASGANLSLHMKDKAGETFYHRLGPVNWKGWKKFTIPAEGRTLNDISLQWQQGSARTGTIYIDDVSVQSTLPPWGDARIRYAGPMMVQANATQPMRFVLRGYRNPKNMQFRFTASIGTPTGKTISREMKDIKLESDTDVDVVLPLTTNSGLKAYVNTRLETLDGKVVCESHNAIYLLPDVSFGEDQPNSIFGLATNKNADPGKTAGAVKWLRMDFDYGPEFETEAKRFDEALARAQEDKIMVLGILNPREFIYAYEKGDQPLSTWIEWVTKVVSRYKGRVQYWEICNEPNNWKMPDVYVTLAKAAYITGKKADPDCFMGAFSASIELPFFEYCLQAGLADYFDFVTVHPYQWSPSFNETMLLGDIASLETLLNKYHCRRPIWITEIGWPTHPKGGSTEALQGIITAQALCALAGVEKYKTFWYTLGDWAADPTDAEGYFGLFNAAGQPKPAFYSYYIVSKILSNARTLSRADVPEGCTGWRYWLDDGRLAMSIWKPSPPAARVSVKLPDLKGSNVEIHSLNLQKKTIQANDGCVELRVDASPQILVYPTDKKFNLPAKPALATKPKLTNPVFLTHLKPNVFYAGQPASISVGIVNLTDNDLKQTIYCKLPKGWGAAKKKNILAKAGEETKCRFDIIVPAAIKTGTYPISIKSPKCSEMQITVEVGLQLGIEVLPIQAAQGQKDIPLEIILRNPTRETITGALEIHLPDGTVQSDPDIKVDLKPGEEVNVTKTISTCVPWIEFKGTLGRQGFQQRHALNNTYIPKATSEIQIDGDLAEWNTILQYRLNQIEQVQQIKTWWTGPEDLSADVWFQWDATYLYFAAAVQDDIHRQPSTGGSTWMGDGFQIAFASGDTYAHELCFSLTSEGPQLFCLWTIGDTSGPVEGAKVAVRREDKQTYYEAAIPWSSLQPINPTPNSTLRLNFILNENDGTTREGYLECRPGIGDGKAVKQWYEWRLGE